MGHTWDIDKIRCYIDLSQGSPKGFFNRQSIHELFSKEVSLYFDKYGLSYEIIPLGAMGGGVGNILIEAMRDLWQSRGILKLIISTYNLVAAIPKFINIKLNNKVHFDKPRVTISLSLALDKDSVYSNIISAHIERLIILKFISDDLCNNLKKDNPLFNFDQSFTLTIYAHEFSVNYTINAEKQNVFNTYRLIKLIKSLYIKQNVYIRYNFTNLNLISRLDNKLNIYGKAKASTPYKKYYLLLSTRIIMDYFEIIKNLYNKAIVVLRKSKGDLVQEL